MIAEWKCVDGGLRLEVAHVSWAALDRLILTIIVFIWLFTLIAFRRHAPPELKRPTRNLILASIMPVAYTTARFILHLTAPHLTGETFLMIQAALNTQMVIGITLWFHAARRAYGRMNHLARTDALTGLHNRLGFEEALQGIPTHPAFGRYAVLQMDLDGFKAVNDSFGHVSGDHVLQKMSAALTGELGREDIVARVGGDEFTAILAGADYNTAFNVATSLKARVGKLAETESLNLSIGIALYPDDALDISDLIRLADDRMYQNKRESTAHESA